MSQMTQILQELREFFSRDFVDLLYPQKETLLILNVSNKYIQPFPHSPSEQCDNVRRLTQEAPAPEPNTVTRPGSPPSAAMFSFTQRRAWIWSSSPQFPLAAWSPVLRKPVGRRHEVNSQTSNHLGFHKQSQERDVAHFLDMLVSMLAFKNILFMPLYFKYTYRLCRHFLRNICTVCINLYACTCTYIN